MDQTKEQRCNFCTNEHLSETMILNYFSIPTFCTISIIVATLGSKVAFHSSVAVYPEPVEGSQSFHLYCLWHQKVMRIIARQIVFKKRCTNIRSWHQLLHKGHRPVGCRAQAKAFWNLRSGFRNKRWSPFAITKPRGLSYKWLPWKFILHGLGAAP